MKEIINQIESLREIKPDSFWVSSTRGKIFEEKESFSFNFFSKPAMATFATLSFVTVLMFSAQTANPGDTLYLVKKMTEKSRFALVPQESKQDLDFLLAHRRLDEVSEIVRKQEIEKLSLAIKELESVKSRMQKNFAQSVESKPREEAVKIAKNLAPAVLEIEDKEELLIGSLGVVTDTNLSSSTAKELAFFLIQDYQERSLTEMDQVLFDKAVKEFENESYRSALRTVLEIGQVREVE